LTPYWTSVLVSNLAFCSVGNARALWGTSPYLRVDESLRV
jgi:hypothetical protein